MTGNRLSELITDEMVDVLARRHYTAMVRVDKYPQNAPTWEDFGGPFKDRIIEGARAELESFAPLIAGRALRNMASRYRAEWAPRPCPWVGALDDEVTRYEKGEADPGLLVMLLGAALAVLAGAGAIAIATGLLGWG